jgi:hypothetical protein
LESGTVTQLSIFTDESGDFGPDSDYYVLAFVFHDQAHPITGQLDKLAGSLRLLGLSHDRGVHTGALLRREEEYRLVPIPTRKAAFTRLLAFTHAVDVTYEAFLFRKRDHSDRLALKGAISRALALFLRGNANYFLGFDQVIAYYDNGQAEITDILNTLFNAFFFDVKFRKVLPSQYRLFQVADLVCTLELLRAKLADGKLSKSDLYFFRDKRSLRKDYLDKLGRKRFRPAR